MAPANAGLLTEGLHGEIALDEGLVLDPERFDCFHLFVCGFREYAAKLPFRGGSENTSDTECLLNNEIKNLSVIVQANESDMTADLSQLETMKKAFENISNIYTDILQTIRPVMKKLLNELEMKFGNDVNSMPEDKADALFNISRLLKEMAEKRIVPYSREQLAIHQNVCEYSNDLSKKYNELKETIINITPGSS